MKTGRTKRQRRARRLSLENLELKAEIDRTRHRMEAVRNQLEEVVDPTLIDCYIYELKAVQLRYQFLLRRFKLLEEVCATESIIP
ncbi:MAG TPA: YaaL family protein [Candidatus Ventrimonas merdavium]|nr:YaaL family protein [Candidatus Ventrimonas merdavium]